MPLLMLACLAAIGGLAGLSAIPFEASESGIAHAAPWAAMATLACLLLAVPVALTRPGPIWFLPAWLGFGIGLAGWSLLALPHGTGATGAEIAGLLLPVAVFCLAGNWAALPPGLWRTAAASGAGSAATIRLVVLPLAWRGLLGTAIVVFILAIGLLGGLV
jgi:ABC-type spermidine/putrescine transport system permease subunit I